MGGAAVGRFRDLGGLVTATYASSHELGLGSQ